MESLLDSHCLLASIATGNEYPAKVTWKDYCPFCRVKLSGRDFEKRRTSTVTLQRIEVSYCETCGWWKFVDDFDDCNTPRQFYHCSILQTFDLKSTSVPIDVLELELPKWIDRIGSLNPQRMEDIVRRILSHVWKCEVKHLGYTRDGGTDLLILDGEKPIAVQVKRRASSQHRELVSGIREFLGAALLSGQRRLMYVTTAERFTKGAREAATRSADIRLVESFELVSMREIRAFLPAMPNRNPWDFALERANNRICAVPSIPNPYDLMRP